MGQIFHRDLTGHPWHEAPPGAQLAETAPALLKAQVA